MLIKAQLQQYINNTNGSSFIPDNYSVETSDVFNGCYSKEFFQVLFPPWQNDYAYGEAGLDSQVDVYRGYQWLLAIITLWFYFILTCQTYMKVDQTHDMKVALVWTIRW